MDRVGKNLPCQLENFPCTPEPRTSGPLRSAGPAPMNTVLSTPITGVFNTPAYQNTCLYAFRELIRVRAAVEEYIWVERVVEPSQTLLWHYWLRTLRFWSYAGISLHEYIHRCRDVGNFEMQAHLPTRIF